MSRILHIFPPHNHFLQHAIKICQHHTSEHIFWEIQPNNKAGLLEKVSENVTLIRGNSFLLQKYTKDNSKQLSMLLFHSLLKENFSAAWKLKSFSSVVPFGWVIHGAEVVQYQLNPAKYLLPQTRKVYYHLGYYRKLLPLWRGSQRMLGRDLKTLLKNFTYLLHFMPEEIEWVKQEIGLDEVNFKTLFFTYVTLETYFPALSTLKTQTEQKKLLLANSATFTSNHLDFVENFRDELLEINPDIIIPLNYGNLKYANFLTQIFTRDKTLKFFPLSQYLPFDEYQKILSGCSAMVFNHIRQQGLGNLLMGLWLGSRIYLQPVTSTFKYFSRKKFYIFNLSVKPLEVNFLSHPQILHNKQLLEQHFSLSVVQEKLFKPLQE